jgi:hypothetical protein
MTPKGEKEEAGSYWTLMKVKVKSYNNISYRHTLILSGVTWGHLILDAIIKY